MYEKNHRRLRRAAPAVLAIGALLVSAETSPPGDPAPAAMATAVAALRTLSATLSADGVVESAAHAAVIRGRGAAVPAGKTSSGTAASTSVGAQAEQPAPTLTAIAGLGATVKTGTIVYSADAEPVVAIVGGTPSWRTLKPGVADGPDVRTLETALARLGFAGDLTVDDHFTAATADAVEDWEESLHRGDPDGAVDPAEILLVDAESQVVEHSLAAGAALPDGTQVLTLASTERVLTAGVDAEDVAGWKPGASVTVRWPDGTDLAARVRSVGRDVDAAAGTVDVTVVPKSGTIRQHTGAVADLSLVTRSSADAVTIPVAAVHDGSGGPAVTLVTNGSGAERPVALGLVAQGRAEIASGLRVGDVVGLPGRRR